jgi:hypothetical protein
VGADTLQWSHQGKVLLEMQEQSSEGMIPPVEEVAPIQFSSPRLERVGELPVAEDVNHQLAPRHKPPAIRRSSAS